MSSSESDVEMKKHSVPKKVTKKTPTSPSKGMLKNTETKKITTKQMIHEAISDLTANSRKGVSLHAIKKYMVDKYAVDIDRIGFLIRKNIKSGVEDGSILQTKGIGVSGSFRMSAKSKEKKKKMAKAKTMKKPKEKTTEKSEKSELKKSKNVKIVTEEAGVKKKKTDDGKAKSKTKTGDKKEKIEKKEKTMKKGGEKAMKTSKTKEVKTKETKKSSKVKAMETPAKKKATMMKRKSIGSIIKPPKMKPKARE